MHLKERFRRLEIQRVVYFHCDHWEPWRAIGGESAVSQRVVDDVGEFIRQLDRIDFARRLTLFYKPQLGWAIQPPCAGETGQRGHPEDQVRFAERTPTQKAIYSSALSQVVTQSRHAIELHIHHENIVHNTDHRTQEARDFFSSPDARRHEEARLEVMIQRSLQAIRDETGLELSRWFFVHGHWALNASDPKVCHVTREIEILLANGCRGDFTMPAGRGLVNPRLAVPYFVNPIDAPKGYDLQEAEPEFAYGNARAASSKFFIWSSRIKHSGCSLDYYAPWLRLRLENPHDLAREIITDSFCVDGTLFIKTHAHSLHANYYVDTERPRAPHALPQIQTLFGMIFEAATAAGVDVQFCSAAEVYDMFVNANHVPVGGYDLRLPGVPQIPLAIDPPPSRAPGASPPRVAPARHTFAPRPQAHPAIARPPPREIDFAATASRVNAVASQWLTAKIEAVGLDPAGAGSYYGSRLRQGNILAGYEIDLAAEILAAPDAAATYVEVGCGFGVLTLLLSACGLTSIGVEPDTRRIAGARDISETYLGAAPALDMIEPKWRHAAFQDYASDTDLDQSIGIFTSIISANVDRKRFMHDTARFNSVIIDVQRFLLRAATREGQDALIAELCSHGLSEPQEFLDVGSDGRYVAFRGGAHSARLTSVR